MCCWQGVPLIGWQSVSCGSEWLGRFDTRPEGYCSAQCGERYFGDGVFFGMLFLSEAFRTGNTGCIERNLMLLD